ncbi:hypothetical protein ACIBPB_05940 [Micromonospora sp. NPDC049836]
MAELPGLDLDRLAGRLVRPAPGGPDRPVPEWTAGAGVAPVPPQWRRSS